jgi:hypothetical protein
VIAFAGLVAVMFVVVAAGGFAVSCARSLAAGAPTAFRDVLLDMARSV